MKKQLFTALFALLLAAMGRGQDAHFTQMFHAGSFLNPALTGVFEQKAEYRAAIQYRQQWATLAPAYRDFMASVEKSGRAWQFGGLLYGHDAGAASLRTTGFRVSSALQKMIGPGQNALSLGLSLGIAQQRFDPAALTFSNQYDDEKGYLAAHSNGELFENTKQLRPDFAIGLGWRAHFFSEKNKPSGGCFAGACCAASVLRFSKRRIRAADGIQLVCPAQFPGRRKSGYHALRLAAAAGGLFQ